MRTFNDKINSAIKNWWLSLLLGVLFVIGGIWLLLNPMASYAALSILFAAFMFVSGLFEVIFAVANKDNISSWGWYLAGGIIDFLIGILLLASPGLSMAVLPFILAFWLMFRGFSGIGASMDLRRYGIRNWGWLLAISILAVLLAIGIIWIPAAGALTFVFMVAYALVVIGIYRIAISFELRHLHRRNQEHHKE